MSKNIQYLSISIISIFCLFFLTGCTINTDETKTVEDKTKEEISYFEDELLVLINRYAKREYIIDDKIDWKSVQNDAGKINTSIDTILLDLSETKLSNDDIVNFSNEVNNLNIAISKEDEVAFIQSCNYLYSLLPIYLEKISNNKNEIDLMKLKSIAISSFVQSNYSDWASSKTTIALAETKYKEMMDNIDYMQEYSYNLNKVYILIEELKNAIDLEEKELTRVKYINFIEKV